MFSNRIVQVPTADIRIDRSNRQRTNLTFDSVIDLLLTIAQSQWISPVLIDQGTNHIVAGERRLTAVKALNAAVNGDFSGFSNPEEARTLISPVCSCQVDSWNQWAKIPCQLGHDLTEKDLSVYEFIENAQREGLSWQDRAKAIYTIHAHALADDKDWSNTKTGKLIGLDPSTIAKYLKVWRVMVDDPAPEVQLIVNESPTLNSALQTLVRYTSRRQDDVVSLSGKAKEGGKSKGSIGDTLVALSNKPGPSAGIPQPVYDNDLDLTDSLDLKDEEASLAPIPLGNQLLVCADFHTWAAEYTGPPFNFLHCDFPYGISFNKGDQTSTVKNKLEGDYDDSAEVYWGLLNTLVQAEERLIADSAHIMFWYSQNLERETEDFFAKHFPQATLQPFKLIWHCSDSDGIVPDPQRYGRRTYETAMVLSFGDRHIVTPKALSFAAPRESKTRHHRSQKPMSVLTHFMSMFVDDASSVLDPTAGSGTSLLVAHQLGAKAIVGIEKEEKTYATSLAFLNKRSDLISL